MGLGRALRKLRTEANLTQQELARRTQLSPSQVSKIENGKGNPRWGTTKRIAAVLGIELVELADQAEYFEQRLRGDSA